MVPTILGVSGQPKQRSATGVAVTGNPGLHARSKERRARKVTTVYGQSSVDNNVMHLASHKRSHDLIAQKFQRS